MLQRLILTCLGLSSKHMTTWNQVSLQETYTLQTWVFQCRYSAEIWCILDCLLCNTSSLFEQGKWRDLLLAHLQQTLAFIVNPTTHVLLLFQKYVDGNKELFVSNEHFLFNLVSPPKMALCVQGLLQCVFSNQVSDFQPWRYALQESTHCFTTKCLIISLDVLSVTRTLLTQLDHKLTDVTLLAECDEHVLRLLWQAALTGSSFTLQTENPIDLWKTPSLTKTNVDRRLLLLESLVEFLHVSHVYHYAISPTFLSVVISVLNRVKPKCQTFIPTFYSRDENYAHLEKNVEEKITHFIHLLKSSFYGRFHSEGNNIVEQTRIKNYLDSFLRKQQPSRNVFETDTPLCDATLHRSEDEANNVEKFSTFDLTTSNSSTQGNVLAKKTEPLSSHMMPKASDNEKDIYENVEHTPVQVSFNQNTASENLHSSFRFTTLTNEITMHDCLSVKNEQLTTGFNVNQQSLYPPVKENPQTTPTSSVHSISSHNSLKYSDSHTAEEKDVLFETCNNDEMLHCTTPLAHSSDTDVSVQSNDIQFSSIHLLQSYDEALSTSQPEHQCEITSVLRYCGFNVSETPKKEEQSKAILQTPQASCDSDTFATIETDPQNTLSDSICKENLDTNFINNATPSPSNCTRTFKVDKDSQQMNDDDFLAALGL
ncbi:uncharacterized protein LOC128883306 [Hylaeus volcanicus]|uniref:uncharacterized protein LOC128883306 n=1 Tax=Hylaeus volcanicus TaxID=313075 RepID=UPI0023B79B87|nr:uncharacterized protein LOC128883306 [Hylaeus volcanicus]